MIHKSPTSTAPFYPKWSPLLISPCLANCTFLHLDVYWSSCCTSHGSAAAAKHRPQTNPRPCNFDQRRPNANDKSPTANKRTEGHSAPSLFPPTKTSQCSFLTPTTSTPRRSLSRLCLPNLPVRRRPVCLRSRRRRISGCSLLLAGVLAGMRLFGISRFVQKVKCRVGYTKANEVRNPGQTE